MAEAWIPAVCALAGALIGAVLAYVAAMRAVREQRSTEWGTRFTVALGLVAGDTYRQRSLGRCVLVELARSDKATEEERCMARQVLLVSGQMREVEDMLAGVSLDEVTFQEDTGSSDDEQEGPR